VEHKFNKIVNYIKSIYNSDKVFLHEPHFCGNEKEYLNDCIDSTYVSSVGKYVDLFEKKVALYTGAEHAVACVNGTSAIHIALILSGVKCDDEVITQPLTFIATANAIKYCNASPVFVDVDKDTMGLSPLALEHFLKNNAELNSNGCFNHLTKKRISACLPVHTYGFPCRIDEIVEICNQYQIPVIEDAAESIGSVYKGKHTGTFGKVGIISFNGNKTITTGGGGMLLFMDEDLYKKAKHVTTQAKMPHPWKFEHDKIGYNYRMPNINAAVGVAQMEQLDLFLESKRKLAEQYLNFFYKLDIQCATEIKYAKANYWLNCIFMKGRQKRDEFLNYTNNNGVMTRPAWKLMNELPMYKSCQSSDLKNAHWLEERLVNIPSSVIL
jgi:perosamine synthetase